MQGFLVRIGPLAKLALRTSSPLTNSPLTNSQLFNKPMVSNRMTVSIVIPVLNGGEDFRRCLDSICQGDRQPDELIVVNDGSGDGSGELARYYGARVVDLPHPHGPAFARNQGASLAQSEVVFFVDADVTLQPTTLSQVAAAFETHPEIDALIGSYDDQPGAANFTSQYRNLLHHYTHQVSSPDAATFWGACGAVRRSVFLAVGGFDERYLVPCIEDIELGYRLTRAGHRIRLCKSIQVKHLKRWQLVKMVQTDVRCRALPWTALLLRDRHPMNDLNLKRENRLSVVCAFLSLLLPLALWLPALVLPIVALALGGLFVLNRDLYHFLGRHRGGSFTLRAMAYHWLFYVYSGLAYAFELGRYLLFPQSRTNPRFQTTIPQSLQQAARQRLNQRRALPVAIAAPLSQRQLSLQR